MDSVGDIGVLEVVWVMWGLGGLGQQRSFVSAGLAAVLVGFKSGLLVNIPVSR